MSAITLQMIEPFCSVDETRPQIMQPWFRDGFTYATTGRILIRIPGDLGVAENEKSPNAGSLFDCKPLPEGAALEPLPFAVPAHHPTKCEKCEGDGYIKCHHCASVSDCDACDGSGESERDQRWARISGIPFYLNYLRLVQGLPGVRAVAVEHNSGCEEPDRYLRFTADGGLEGILQCYRPYGSDRALEWKPEAEPRRLEGGAG